ncbi:hypothetical protein GOODEAATRI_034637, partial [Goodea atripinnis]
VKAQFGFLATPGFIRQMSSFPDFPGNHYPRLSTAAPGLQPSPVCPLFNTNRLDPESLFTFSGSLDLTATAHTRDST